MASSSRHFKTREDYKKSKELEEARKAGTVAPQVDEEGHDINPHIPEYIKQSPWYLDISLPSLKHQKLALFDRSNKAVTPLKLSYTRGCFLAAPATKYREGACTNCGAITHTTSTCTDRPRKIGARWSGKSIRPDEVIEHLEMDYAAKRDRWNGHEPERYQEVIELYEKIENARRTKRAQAEMDKYIQIREEEEKVESERKLQLQLDLALAEKKSIALSLDPSASNIDPSSTTTTDDPKESTELVIEDDYKADDTQDNVGQFARIDGKSHRSVRDLRIREDTAKYLLNLNENSPFYDPKSRSMRANPFGDEEEVVFHGDNANRFTGDTKRFYEMQKFAWEAGERGESVHLQATPSESAKEYELSKLEKQSQLQQTRQLVFEQYGVTEHSHAAPNPVLLVQSEIYREYLPDGHRAEKEIFQVNKSKYEEDQITNGHSSIWGSWWHRGEWGYLCCKEMVRNAYCTSSEMK